MVECGVLGVPEAVTVSEAPDEAPKGMPQYPSMPEIAGNDAVAVWRAGRFLLVLLLDLKPRSARVIGEAAASSLHYNATLAVLDQELNAPQMYITLETSAGGTFFCRFNERGVQENFGPVSKMSLGDFIARAIDMFRQHFNFSGEIANTILRPEPDVPAKN